MTRGIVAGRWGVRASNSVRALSFQVGITLCISCGPPGATLACISIRRSLVAPGIQIGPLRWLCSQGRDRLGPPAACACYAAPVRKRIFVREGTAKHLPTRTTGRDRSWSCARRTAAGDWPIVKAFVREGDITDRIAVELGNRNPGIDQSPIHRSLLHVREMQE